METLAFIHSADSYGEALPMPESIELNLKIPSSAWVSFAAVAIAASIMTTAQDAKALVGPGDSGSAVSAVQQALRNRGYNVGGVDGVFGSQTEYALTYFQQDNGLSADGIVGPSTAAALGLADPGDSNSPYGYGNGSSSGGTASNGTVTITASSGLYVRSGPGTGYAVVGGLPYGSVVNTYGYSNGWYRVSGGWISSTYTGGGTASDPDPGDGYVTVNTPIGLYVRSGPGTGYAVVGGLGYGETVATYDYYNGWYKVSGGWISSSYVN